MKAIIIDDETHCQDRLLLLLQEYCPGEIEILSVCSDIDSGIDAIRKHQPELLFLDVQINELTGFDLLERIGKADFRVIFTTAYENYAFRAIKFSAADYLLKPIDPDDLVSAIGKIKSEQSARTSQEEFRIMHENLRNLSGKNRRIAVPTQTEILFLAIDEIVRCESDVNYTTLFLRDRKKLVVAKTLKNFEALLLPYNFFRVHNSHLINLDLVRSYNKGKGGYAILEDGSAIEVSTRRKEEFLQRLAGI